MMLLASGVNFGFRRTVPHMFGIAFGFCVLLLCIGFGLGSLLSSYPALHTGLKIAGATYLVYLSWKIATARPTGADVSGDKATPMSFLAAAAFQWVNPKAWMMAVTAMAVFVTPEDPVTSVILVALAFTIVNFPSVSIWAGFGTGLSRFLTDVRMVIWFNRLMGLTLALSIYPMVT